MEDMQNPRIKTLNEIDPAIARVVKNEIARQEESLEMIASENFVSFAVMEASGSVLTNKYAEGYPGHRWYQGCENVDDVEALAIARGKELFGAEHVNVQPHSGSQANEAAYLAVLNPGDTILAMKLSHGGHLTHGHPKNISGRFFNIVSYGVKRETELIDYDEIERLAKEHTPKLIVAGASAYPRVIDFERLRTIADKAGALLMVDMAHFTGLVAGGAYPSPIPHADFVTATTHKTMRGPRGGLIFCKKDFASTIDTAVFPGSQGGPCMHTIAAKAVCFQEAMSDSFKDYAHNMVKNCKRLAQELKDRGWRLLTGGTDTHLLLIDLAPKNLTGKEAADVLQSVHITANKNLSPFDEKSPFLTSGLRLGTPALTTRDMGEEEMRMIAGWISDVLLQKDDSAIRNRIKHAVIDLCQKFPLYRFEKRAKELREA